MVWGGVCVRGGVGCLGGFGVPYWWLWGVGGGVENTQKIHRRHRKYKGEPLDKKSLREVG